MVSENVIRRPLAPPEARSACRGADKVYQLAADMGGMGFIEHNKALCMLLGAYNTHMLMGAKGSQREALLLFVQRLRLQRRQQTSADVVALKEGGCVPGSAEDGYGWEKLFSERMCRHFREDFGLAPAWRGTTTVRSRGHMDGRPREGAAGCAAR